MKNKISLHRSIRFAALGTAVFISAWSSQASATLYGLGSDSTLYTLDSGTGAATAVADVAGTSLVGASFLSGDLYGSDIFQGSLRTGIIDTSTGAYTGVSDQDGSANWHGLASDESAGLLYSIDINDNNILKSLSAIGVVVSIGTGTGIDGRGMAYDDVNDILYATGSGGLYTVDVTSGLASLIGSIGLTNSALGLAYDELNDVLFLNDSNTQSLYTLNTATGAATLVGANGGNTQIDGLAWIGDDGEQVPVPATVALLGLGLIGVFYGRQTRKQTI